jgi:enamine deaminase RidA (YjgF/YER057c/UK114 family)
VSVLQPAGWPRPRGYANGVSASGEQVFVAGMVGSAPAGGFPSDRLAGQVRQALLNVVSVLTEAGARPEHIVRMTWYVTDMEEYRSARAEMGAAFREVIGTYDMAMTCVEVSRLVDDDAKVEIEVTALVPSPLS